MFRCASSRSNSVWEFDDEVVAIRHLHLRQRLRVHHLILWDEIVRREQIGAQLVDHVISERVRRMMRLSLFTRRQRTLSACIYASANLCSKASSPNCTPSSNLGQSALDKIWSEPWFLSVPPLACL